MWQWLGYEKFRTEYAPYVPVCPPLQDGQYLVLADPTERADYNEIVREKILRCPLLVFCGRRTDATTAAQIGLAQKYGAS